MSMMRAAVFEKQGSIKLREVPKPKPGVGEALIRVTLTTICGTDVHIFARRVPGARRIDRRARAGGRG